jgi:hypothetical protein
MKRIVGERDGRVAEVMEKKQGAETAASSTKSRTGELNLPLHVIGFEVEELSPQKVTGRLRVTQNCCQVESQPSQSSSPACPLFISFLSLFLKKRFHRCTYNIDLWEIPILKTAIQGAAWRGIGSDS